MTQRTASDRHTSLALVATVRRTRIDKDSPARDQSRGLAEPCTIPRTPSASSSLSISITGVSRRRRLSSDG